MRFHLLVIAAAFLLLATAAVAADPPPTSVAFLVSSRNPVRDISAGDLRLLMTVYSLTILVLAAVVDERQHDRGQVEKLRTAETALRESEERFRRVFEEGPLGLALVGRDYRFLKVNSALCEMVGYAEAELVQKTFAEITHPDDLRADVELVERLFKREIPFYRMQKRYHRKNGEFIWINLTASILLGPMANLFMRLP